MSTAVIIDDVAEARTTLRRDLGDYCPNVNIVGEAEGVLTGLKLVRAEKPEIVFLDIQMRDGSGFDLLELLDEVQFKVIFTTASDAFAIKAFRFSAIDYLLKPIDPDDLMAAVKKAEGEKAPTPQHMDLLKDNLQHGPKRIALHTQDKIQLRDVDEIIRCEANVNYTTFYFTNGSKLMVTRTLKVFDQILGDSGFYRVHQSHLVNTRHIKEFVKGDGGYIVMNDESTVPISSRKKPEVMKLLSSIS